MTGSENPAIPPHDIPHEAIVSPMTDSRLTLESQPSNLTLATTHASLSPTLSQSTASVQAPFRRNVAITLSILLVVIGACSDAAQKLFGVGETLGVDNVEEALLSENQNLASILRLVYLFLGTLAAFSQSIYLEKSYTHNFIKGKLALPVDEDLSPEEENVLATLREKYPDQFTATTHLNRVEAGLLGITGIGGAAMRFFSSVMGFYTISNNKTISGAAFSCSGTDAIQTIATDGEYLIDFYLSSRLGLRNFLGLEQYQPEFLNLMQWYFDKENHSQTWPGTVVHFMALWLFGTLSALSDVGLTKLATDDFFTEVMPINIDSDYFYWLEMIGLTCSFLLMFALDARSLANAVTSRVEACFYPEMAERLSAVFSATDTAASTEASPNKLGIACGLTLSVLGGSMTAISAYTGSQYLFSEWFPAGNKTAIEVLSVIISVIKFSQSLSVEGRYTIQGLAQTRCCSVRPASDLEEPLLAPSSTTHPCESANRGLRQIGSGVSHYTRLNTEASETLNPITANPLDRIA